MSETAEQVTILYCVRCDWELKDGAIACANECPKCQKRGLRYVRYDPATEETEARAVIAEWRQDTRIQEVYRSYE